MQSELPKLMLPFHFKQSSVSNRVFIQPEQIENVSNMSIPLTTLNRGIKEFSIVPVSLKFGEKNIVIPMLLDSGNNIPEKLNEMWKDGYQNLCSLPFEVVSSSVNKTSEVSQDNNNANDKTKRPVSKNVQTRTQNTKFTYEDASQQINIANHNDSPNPVRLMATIQNHNMNRFPNFNVPPPNYFRGPSPRQSQNQPRYRNEQQTTQQNSRQMPYNNGNTRFPGRYRGN